jgi:hypothetical protein
MRRQSEGCVVAACPYLPLQKLLILVVTTNMDQDYLRFKLFTDKAAAEDFADVLKQNNIDYRIDEDALTFDASFANDPLAKDYVIAIKQPDFIAASLAYDEYFAKRLGAVPDDYYLLQFSDEELEEILARPDEWGAFDYQLAQELLRKRGVEITNEKRDRLKVDRYYALAQPEGEAVTNIVGYYIVSIFFFPVGWIIGWTWGYSKKQMPDGYRVYAYNETVRNHGRIILLISIILPLFAAISKMIDMI